MALPRWHISHNNHGILYDLSYCYENELVQYQYEHDR